MSSPAVSTRMVKAFGNTAAEAPMAPVEIPRRQALSPDVEIEILYCGICHSDVHTARDEWGPASRPCVPGHEIVGRVTAIGNGVTKFSVGDMVGVGCMVDSCRVCPNCQAGNQQFCQQGATFTYNSPDKHLAGHATYGGYSETITVDEAFVLRLPHNLDPAAAAPLLCAGITTYSPLKRWKVGPGQTVGVVGLGGLGHMGIKIAKAMGARVVVFTTSPGKVEVASALGADEVVLSTNRERMAEYAHRLNFILDTVSAQHEINTYLGLLAVDGTLVLVGAPSEPLLVQAFSLIFGRRNFAGSLIGGVEETQEMLDFCALHNIVSDIELIPAQYINEAYERMLKSDVRYRFVIDMQSIRQPAG